VARRLMTISQLLLFVPKSQSEKEIEEEERIYFISEAYLRVQNAASQKHTSNKTLLISLIHNH
jgi:predicted DNA-binding protein